MALMWGYPFLTAGLGLEVGVAAGIFSLLVVGDRRRRVPVIGYLVARFPLRRSNLVLAVVSLILAVCLVLVIVWPGAPPLWLVVVLFLRDRDGRAGLAHRLRRRAHLQPVARPRVGLRHRQRGRVPRRLRVGVPHRRRPRRGAHARPGADAALYTLDAFRIAFLVPVAVIAIGVVGLLVARRRTRRRMYEVEGIQIAPLWVALFRARRRRRPPAPGA